LERKLSQYWFKNPDTGDHQQPPYNWNFTHSTKPTL